MNNQHQPISERAAVVDEQTLNDDELKTLAKFLDALMEVDFEQQYDLSVATDYYSSQSARTDV